MSSSYLIAAIVVWPEILLTRKVADRRNDVNQIGINCHSCIGNSSRHPANIFCIARFKLGCKYWIAQDNSTEVNTIDLNTPINQTVSGGAAASPDAAAAAEPEPTSTPDDEGEDEEESASDDGEGDEGDEETDEE